MKIVVVFFLVLGCCTVLCHETHEVDKLTDIEPLDIYQRLIEEEYAAHKIVKRAIWDDAVDVLKDGYNWAKGAAKKGFGWFQNMIAKINFKKIQEKMMVIWETIKTGITDLFGGGSKKSTTSAFRMGLAGLSGYNWLSQLGKVTVYRLEPGEKPPTPCHKMIAGDGREVCIKIPGARWPSDANRRRCDKRNSKLVACRPRKNFPNHCYCIALPRKVTMIDIDKCNNKAGQGKVCHPLVDGPDECYCRSTAGRNTPRSLVLQDIARCWTPFDRCIPDIFDPDSCSCPRDKPKRRKRARVLLRTAAEGLISATCFAAEKCTHDIPLA